jgi:hypothetical protein
LIRILVLDGLDRDPTREGAGLVDFRLGPDEPAQLHSIGKRNQMLLDTLNKYKE